MVKILSHLVLLVEEQNYLIVSRISTSFFRFLVVAVGALEILTGQA
jgi:hypothetical protein